MAKKEKLNLNQEKFCQNYAGMSDSLLFGNATKSYMNAYPETSYEAAMTSSSDLLRIPKIQDRVKELLKKLVVDDDYVDSQIGYLIRQGVDWSAKMKAIHEYNLVNSRITKKIKHSGKVEYKLSDKDKEELDNILAANKKK